LIGKGGQQNRTAKIQMTRQDCKESTTRTGQSGPNRQYRVARRDGQKRISQPGQDSKNKNKIARTGQPEDRQ
jgi:hypothetical protein